MKKILIIISLLLFTFACSSTYKVKPYKDKTPIGILLIKMNGEQFMVKL